MPVTVTINGTERQVPDGATLVKVIEALDVPAAGVAVAVNGAVVRRADWPTTALADGATVEVLTAVQGG